MFHPNATKNIRRSINRVEPQDLAGIGSFFKKIGKFVGNNAINAAKAAVTTFVPGGAAFQGLLDKIPMIGGDGSGGGQIKKAKDINTLVSQIIAALESAKAQAANGEDVLASVDQFASILNDSSKVKQQTKGKDGQALSNGRNQVNAKIAEVKAVYQKAKADQLAAAQAAAVQQQQQQQQQSSGNAVSNLFGSSNPNEPNSGGIDSSTLTLAGFGGLALILLLRK
jgi:hypothetical protein